MTTPKVHSFFIEGRPAPGGSKRTFIPTKKNGDPVRRPNGSIMVNVTDDAGPANKEWKRIVSLFARSFMRGAPPFANAIKIEFVFYLRRPQSHYRTGKNCHMLRDGAPLYHTTKPDALKFARSTEDALTGILWNDDAANVRLATEKRYAKSDEREGCAVRFVVL